MSKFKLDSTSSIEYRASVIKSVQSFEELAGEAPETTCEKIFNGIHKELKSSEQQQDLFIGVSCILQRGGTSRNAPSTMKMNINNLDITLDMIRRNCRTHNVSVRQFARGIKQDIIEVMQFLGENAPDGNLAKTMRLDHPDLSKDDAIWASDFQTYNSDCPDVVKKWLVKNYRSRFRKN